MTYNQLAEGVMYSIWEFFPETKGSEVVTVDFRNRLVFSISFYIERFDMVNFQKNFKNFRLFLSRQRIEMIDDLLPMQQEHSYSGVIVEKHFFMVPLDIEMSWVTCFPLRAFALRGFSFIIYTIYSIELFEKYFFISSLK